jgi:HK97 family phage prohead protease
MPAKLNEREYRRIDLTNLTTKEEENYVVEGYATTYDSEYLLWDDGEFRVMESVSKDAFADTDMKDVIMQYDHAGPVFARVSNNTLELTSDDHGLHIRAYLGGTERGRNLFEEIRGGYTEKMSIGFTVLKDERVEERDQQNNKTIIHRKITAVKKLFDVSAVSLPANDATEISARCFGEGVIAEARQELAVLEERKRKIKRIKLLMEVNNEND